MGQNGQMGEEGHCGQCMVNVDSLSFIWVESAEKNIYNSKQDGE
jgi:hypothetical protein